MDSKRKALGYWEDFSNVERELLAFIQEHGTPSVMPTQKQLQKTGRSNLGNAIQKHGGWQAVAERLKLTYAKRRTGYWDDFSNIKRELLDFIHEQGNPDVMPTHEELKKAGRSDLINAISRKHGGYQSVAERLGLELAYTKKRHRYWDNFANVQREILAFIGEKGTPGVMPIHEELKKAKLSSLGAAIQKHGGYSAVAAKLGLKLAYTRKPTDYWDNFANVQREILAFIGEKGTPGVMPTYEELKKAELSSLGAAIQKHGGSPAVAEQLGLKLVDARKPLKLLERV